MIMLLYIVIIIFLFGMLNYLLGTQNKHSILLAVFTFATAIACAAIAKQTLATPLLTSIIIYYVWINIYTLLLYAIDKRAAIKNKWRIPERQLHLFMFSGGVIGAIAGQQIFRHKTQKLSFRIIFWILLILQLSILGWYIATQWIN